MKIKEAVNIIKEISLQHRFVRMFNEGDVYEFMNNGEKEYGIINLTINSIERLSGNMMYLHGSIIYIDRLTEDKGNKLDVWATGTTVLQEIINRMPKDLLMDENYQFNTFIEESFQDLCAGVYADFNARVKNDVNDCDDQIFIDKILQIKENGVYDLAGYNKVEVNVVDKEAHQEIERLNEIVNSQREMLVDQERQIEEKDEEIRITQEAINEDRYINILENGEVLAAEKLGYNRINVEVPSVTVEELTQELYDSLSEKDPMKIYLIIE